MKKTGTFDWRYEVLKNLLVICKLKLKYQIII